MQIIKQACGAYETNCYILFGEHGEIIIDPGFCKGYFKKNM